MIKINKFRIKNNKFKIIVITIIVFISVYFYIDLFINTNLNTFIVNEINSKYESITKGEIKDSLLYLPLNKIITLNDIKISNSHKVIDIENDNSDKNTNEKVNENTTNVSETVKDYKVYIYNTHDTEKYSMPFISDYSITPDVKIASYILKDYLNDLGIDSIVETKSINDYLKKNNLDYKGCYDASRTYMKEASKNNDFKIYIDLHRDSVKHKYTLYEKNNKKYAKIMFVLTTKHKNYKENEKFVNELNNMINDKYNGLSRGIMKRNDVIFNQDLSSHAILVELGGIDNTLEEINNTLEVFASILNEYIKKENL